MDNHIKHIEQRIVHQVELSDGKIYRRSTARDGGSCWELVLGHPDAPFPQQQGLHADKSRNLEEAFQQAMQPKLPPEGISMFVP